MKKDVVRIKNYSSIKVGDIIYTTAGFCGIVTSAFSILDEFTIMLDRCVLTRRGSGKWYLNYNTIIDPPVIYRKV